MKEAEPPRAPRLRRLSDEEIALWTEVARGVARRRGASLPAPSGAPNPAPAPAPPPVETVAPRQAAAAPPLAKIERRLRRRLARGRRDIDDAIDLHGLTQADARHAMRRVLRHSQARGARLVIVVTGKGGPLSDDEPWDRERGVLRRLAPHWLREPDLRSIVLGFEEAGRAHGGSGALYVRLRRR